MAQHQSDCAICERLKTVRDDPVFITETATGVAVMGSQWFRGYCVFLCKLPATELDELRPDVGRHFLADMARLAQAVRAVVQPHKLNLELLGNIVPHLHWHIFPRQLDEEHPLKPVWLCMPPDYEDAPHAFDATRDAPLRDAIRVEFGRLQNLA